MARIPQTKQETLATGAEDNTSFLSAGIGVVDTKGKVSTIHRFSLNPTSFEDSKSAVWAPNAVPGQNHPVYQWVSGGARMITFDALVTKDHSRFPNIPKQDPIQNLLDTALNAVGSIASSFFGVSLPPLGGLFSDGPGAGAGNDLSIDDYLTFYRSLLKPTYTDEGKLASSPPLVVLYFGSSLEKASPVENADIDAATELFMLTNLSIKILKQLPNLAPQEAEVNFQFTQYAISSVIPPG